MLMHIIHCVAFIPSQQVQATQWFELQLLYLSLFGPIRYGACAIDATPTRPLCNHNSGYLLRLLWAILVFNLLEMLKDTLGSL